MKWALTLFYLFLVNYTICGPQLEVDSIPIYALDKVYEHYSGNKFSWTLSRQGLDVIGSQKFSGQHGCSSCRMRGRFVGKDDRTELYISINKMDHILVHKGNEQVVPSFQGRGRLGFIVQCLDHTSTELSIEYSSSPKYNTSIHLHNSRNDLEEWVSLGRSEELGHLFHSLFLGCICMVILFTFSTFFFHRRTDVLFYGLYGFLLLIYFGADYALQNGIFFGSVGHYVKRLVHPVMFISYIFFLKSFINARKEYPSLYRLYDYSVIFLIGVFIVMVFSFPPYNRVVIQTVNQYYQLLAGITAIYVIFLLYKLKPQFYTFLISGHFFLTLGSVLAIILSIYDVTLGFLRPLHWMMIGVVCELIIYSAALGYRMQLAIQEKLDIQKALIGEMKKNETFLENRQKELTEIVQATQTKFIEEERDKIRAEVSLQEKEVELDLLRNQMKPHFIFNSLNSIKSFIIKNQPRIAGDYITKFASLMRLILANSKEIEIQLSKELDAIKLYVELEQLRLEDRFSYTIEVDEDVDIGDVMIQPLILQPFVENAIWHGLRYLDNPGMLKVTISHDDSNLQITIDDNGIGRKASGEKRKSSLARSKSLGISITRERLYKKYKDDFSILIEDLNPENADTGTRVQLVLPINVMADYEYS